MAEVTVLQGAQSELFEIYCRFGEAVDHRISMKLDQLEENPESGPIYADSIRRLVVPKTVLGIFYAIEGARVVVWAVLDLRQEPSMILRRLGKS